MTFVCRILFLGLLLSATVILASPPDPDLETDHWKADVPPEAIKENKWSWDKVSAKINTKHPSQLNPDDKIEIEDDEIEIDDDENFAKIVMKDLLQRVQAKKQGKTNRGYSSSDKKIGDKLNRHGNIIAEDVEARSDQPIKSQMTSTAKEKPSTRYLQQCQRFEWIQKGQITKLNYFKNQIVRVW